MKILLAMSPFQMGSTGLLVTQALNNLGHSTFFWNVMVNNKPPTEEYDMAIVWCNRKIPREKFSKPVCYVYLDDNEFWKDIDPKNTIENCTEGYECIITNMIWEGYDHSKYHFIPMGLLSEIHAYYNLKEGEKKLYASDVVFIGTNRGQRPQLIKYLKENLNSNYTFSVYGNGWEKEGIRTNPVYFYDFTRVLSASKIVVCEHWKNGFSTNDFEKPGVGGALMITDCPIVKTVYPMCPSYQSYEELMQLVHYYLSHEEERKTIAFQMQHIAHQNFTYEHQLSKIITLCQNQS